MDSEYPLPTFRCFCKFIAIFSLDVLTDNLLLFYLDMAVIDAACNKGVFQRYDRLEALEQQTLEI